ncbi:uncharacterized protein [Solanum lycopersicum]|uniref:uncharacterized protein n=1 Tax=Solanum lycopersicum TaxID=4081 RepID=UPI003748857D
MAENTEVWDFICKVPYMPTMEVKDGEVTRVIPKTRKQYNDSDRLLVQKNHKARKLLMCGLSINEYDLISSCESAKEIWDLLETTYEGTEEIRKSKLDLFSTQFEDFTMNDGETINKVCTRFSNITDEIMLLEEPVPIVKIAEGKDKEGDQVCPKISSREVFFREVKRELAAWEKSSSDSDDSENTDNGFMAKIDEEDSDEKVTLSYFKQNLNTFSTSKLRKLAIVLLDWISEMKDEKDLVNNNLDIFQDGKIALAAQISDIESQMVVLETENLKLNEKIKGATTTIFKGKNEASRLQLDLENKLNTAEMKIKGAFKRNHALERDLVRVKEELENSLKWTNFSKILLNIVGQGNNIKGDLSCKRDCPAFKDCGESSSNYSKQRNKLKKGPGPVYGQQKKLQKMGPGLHAKFVRSDSNVEKKHKGPGPCYRFSKNNFSPWTGRREEAVTAMILIQKRCKNMYIDDLITAHSDSLTELSAQGMNAENILEVARKDVFEIEELLQNQRDGLNSEFAEEHPHESNNLKEDDENDDSDEVPGFLDSAKQRRCSSN